MTYAVVWAVVALQGANAVMQLTDPARVRAAQDRIDHMLRRYPRDMGESRVPGCRLWYEDVLGVYYRIDEEQLRVEVLYAGPARRH